MKIKAICLFAALTMLLLLIGCTADDDNIDLTETYHFYQDNGILMKLNVHTGESSTVCIDPVCEHGKDCAFTSVVSYTVHNDTVYFSRTHVSGVQYIDNKPYIEETICAYSYKTGEVKVLCSISSGVDSALQGFIEVYDDYVYFYRQTPDIDVYEFTLYRVPCKGGDAESMKISKAWWHGARQGDTLYYTDSFTKISSIDLNTQDTTDVITISEPASILLFRNTNNTKIFYTLKKESKTELWTLDAKTGETERIYESENDIYNVIIKNETVHFVMNSKIYVLSSDNHSAELVYGDEKHEVLYFNTCGNYLVIKEKGAGNDEFVLLNGEI